MAYKKFLVKKGWFDISLKDMCVVIGSVLACLLGLEALYSPLVIRNVRVFYTWSSYYFANALLTLSAATKLKWLVAVWLVFAAVLIIGVPPAIICVLLDTDYYYYVKDFSHPIYFLICEYLLAMFLYAYSARYVISYFLELYDIEKRTANIHPLAIIL